MKIVGYDLLDLLSSEGKTTVLQMESRGRMCKKQPIIYQLDSDFKCDLGMQQRVVAQCIDI